MNRAAPGPFESPEVQGNTAGCPTVVHITTVDMTLQLLLGALRYLQARGFKVSGVCAPGPGVAAVERAGIQVRTVPFTRRLTPLQDLVALTRLTRWLLHQRPCIVHTHTPKANLLGQWAARLARIPVRVATVHGLYFTTATPSAQRWLYAWMERCSAWPAQTVWLINREDVAIAKARRLCASDKIRLLPGGLGVDLERFDPARYDPDLRRQVREEMGWGAQHFVVGFVGRLVREKGLVELFAAAASLKRHIPALRLLVVGPTDVEKADAVGEQWLTTYGIEDICVMTGRRADTERLYLGMDVLALPSHREGLPVAAMEAQAMGLPLITTDARGCKEVFLPGRTGLMVPARDIRALAAAIAALHDDSRRRREMSQAAWQYARLRFDQVQAFASFEREYLRLLAKRCGT